MVDAAILERAGELKGELVAFSQQPRYERAVSECLDRYGDGMEEFDEQRMILLWDCFVLEHKLANGRRLDHPEDVLHPEQELIEGHVLNSEDRHRYRRAVALLPAPRDAYQAAGRRDAFTKYLEDLRARHTRRPTFIKTLDRANL